MHAHSPLPKRGFFCNPVTVISKKDKAKRDYNEIQLLRVFKQRQGSKTRADAIRTVFEDRGNYYWHDGDLHKIPKSKMTHEFIRAVMDAGQLSMATPASAERKGFENIGKVIKQLKEMGFPIEIQDFGHEEHRKFVRLARMKGAKVIKAKVGETFVTDVAHGKDAVMHRWARDEQTRIGNKFVRPNHIEFFDRNVDLIQELFGEGGSIIKVKDDEFVVSESYRKNPRLRELERDGIKFHFVP
ncbi:MAG: hypothetical protein Q7K42_04065, partial [Candidatus Diapherotrites archaeon]|nr:hypothetical protein [Candidatus Diapherotrites archaeon]